jgi:hypothetical protein
LCSIDPSLSQMISTVNFWGDVFDFLVKTYGPTTREIRATDDITGLDIRRHLLIFNPNHQHLVIHFILFTKNDKAEVYVSRREKMDKISEQKEVVDSLEYDHITLVVNTICYFLWTKLLK